MSDLTSNVIYFAIFGGAMLLQVAIVAIPVWLILRRRRGPRTQHRPDRRHRKPADVEEAQRMAGAEGEEVVAGALKETAARGGCYVFRSLKEPSAGDIDHLVVGPGGVTLVETKANSGTLTWDGSPDGQMLISGKPFKRDLMEQMQNQTRAFEQRFSHVPASEGKNARPLTEYLGEDGRHWLWCFSRARLPGGQNTNRPHITSPKNVSKRIMSQHPLFGSEEVDYIAGRIERAYGQGPDYSPANREIG